MPPDNFQDALAAAGACASRFGHSEVTVTHVTYVLCHTGALNAVFRQLGKDVRSFEDALLEGMATSEGFSATRQGEMKASEGLAGCLHRAEAAARTAGRDSFTIDDFLIEALQNEHGTVADDYARKSFMFLTGRGSDGQTHSEVVIEEPVSGIADATPKSEGTQALALWATDLVAAAERGELDQVFGRESQIDRVRKILARRKKSNPILVGEPGVGKTAVVEGLAVLIASGRDAGSLTGKRIYALDIKGILAGTRNRGDLEERFKYIIDAAAADSNIILFIDEIHTVMVAGGAMAGVADLMKPALASGKIRCIGATTSDEFSKYFGGDPAMMRRFQEVPVEEPGRDEAVEIVRNAARAYELHHGVRYSDEAVIAAVDLSIRHLVDRQLPDKALDILDEAGASATPTVPHQILGEEDILGIVRAMSRDPFVGADDETWARVARDLSSAVAGREQTTSALVGFLRGVSSHPVSRNGSKAAFLLSGPIGGGKRHLAESLASCLCVPILTLDMAAYSERSAVSSLIGAPPGYVGYDDGGKLTEFVRRNPACVVLVDRIELAHTAASEVISSAMAAGQIIDARGRKIGFANAIFIVTQERQKTAGSIGFHGHKEHIEGDGIVGMNFDRIFKMPALDRLAASQLVAGRFARIAASYRAAGIVLDIADRVVLAVVDAGEGRGGKAGDYVAAYVDLFETELFKVILPRRGHVRVDAVNGHVTVEVSNELAS